MEVGGGPLTVAMGEALEVGGWLKVGANEAPGDPPQAASRSTNNAAEAIPLPIFVRLLAGWPV